MGDMMMWKERLERRNKDWDVRCSTAITKGTYFCGSILQDLGALLAEEVVAWLKEFIKEGAGVCLHFVSHSLGGLIVRAALPAVCDSVLGHREVCFGHVLTLNSPHLGIHTSSAVMIWKNWGKMVPNALARQIRQLTLQDAATREDARPRFLEQLANPRSKYVLSLALFRHRTAVAATHWDVIVPFCTAAICGMNPFPSPSVQSAPYWRVEHVMGFHPDSKLALCKSLSDGEDVSQNFNRSVSSIMVENNAANYGTRESWRKKGWIKTSDQEVSFPVSMLKGLETGAPWRRVAYTMHRPPWFGGGDVHLFPIGKDRRLKVWSLEFIDTLISMFEED